MAFRGNVPCVVTKLRHGETDMYGQAKVELTSTSVMCGIVKIQLDQQKTSVRTDTSGSIARAEEYVAASRILFGPYVDIEVGDQVDVVGQTLEVMSVFPRYSVGGKLDHFQVDLRIWGSR